MSKVSATMFGQMCKRCEVCGKPMYYSARRKRDICMECAKERKVSR